MNEIEEKLMLSINEMISDKNIRVLNININKINKSSQIKIIIDSDDGVSVEDCAFVSKISNNLIELENDLQTTYTLEVSSPGINRELYNVSDFHAFKGFKVKIKLKRILNKHKNILGTIESVNGEYILINNKEEKIKINFNDIKKANLQKDIEIKRK
tara:strand:+ start:190 stop:660 length:471 start_codon:yes stop_codon:yes gene_type:complete